MQVNGTVFEAAEGFTLLQLLDQMGVQADRVAVMVNDDIYPSGRIPDLLLNPSDVIEVVRAMQGG